MLIQRFAARAYVMDARNEGNVSATLKGLAQTDFYAAKQYPIPKRFTVVSEHGELKASVHPANFNQYVLNIVDPVLEDLACSCPDTVGIAADIGSIHAVPNRVRFGHDPYIIITYLLEDAHGNLKPCGPDAGESP